MDDVSLTSLFTALVALLFLSACFSGSETALMTLNRYRLRHLAKAGHRGAQIAERLLKRPDRLIGLILLGNNLVNFTASSLATLIALRIGGEAAVAVTVGLFTLTVLIFAEVLPKTFAALRPERVAYPAAWVYLPLLKITYPLVWLVNVIANTVLRAVGIRSDEAVLSHLSKEELRTVVNDAGAMIPKRHQKMLLSILDLEKVTVDDIMVPRSEIVGLDLAGDWNDVTTTILDAQHTRLPVWKDGIDNMLGIVHVRRLLRPLARGELDQGVLESMLREPYFVPEGTPLNMQLLNFQGVKRRIGLTVDEYGDITGLITLEDILEEIVGEFTTDPASAARDVFPDADGTFLVKGSVGLRRLNRALNLHLPTEGPRTLNGLITEYLEAIPEPGTCLLLSGYPVEIVQTSGNAVRTARIRPWKVQAGTKRR